MITYESFLENLKEVKNNIKEACDTSGRNPETITILPVTKTHPPEVIEYIIKVGLNAVGESRVQEAIQKQEHVKTPIQWELIGHLQSNKVNLAVNHFSRIQSVNSIKLIEKIGNATKMHHQPFPILIQVNAANDPAKYGITCEEVESLIEVALEYQNLHVQGLMTIGMLNPDLYIAEKTFNRLRELRDKLQDTLGIKLPVLSMGMSYDYIEAVKAGSTLLRIGSSLLDKRQ